MSLKHNSLGVREMSRGNYAVAIAHFTDAIEHDPPNAVGCVYLNRGLSHAALHNYNAAVSDLIVATEKCPLLYRGWISLAKISILLEDYSLALKAATTATNVDPSSMTGYTLKAFALYHLCHHSAAIHECINAMQITSTCSIPALNIRGLSYAACGDYEHALVDLNLARCRVHPESGSDENELITLWNFAEVTFLRGDLKSALDGASELLRLRPNFKGGLLVRGKALYGCGNKEKALQDLESGLRQQDCVASLYFNSKCLDSALHAQSALVLVCDVDLKQTNICDSTTAVVPGMVHSHQVLEKASNHASESLRLLGELSNTAQRRRRVLRIAAAVYTVASGGDPRCALNMFAPTVNEGPDFLLTWQEHFLCGKLRLMIGDTQAAMQDIMKCLKMCPGFVPAHEVVLNNQWTDVANAFPIPNQSGPFPDVLTVHETSTSTSRHNYNHTPPACRCGSEQCHHRSGHASLTQCISRSAIPVQTAGEEQLSLWHSVCNTTPLHKNSNQVMAPAFTKAAPATPPKLEEGTVVPLTASLLAGCGCNLDTPNTKDGRCNSGGAPPRKAQPPGGSPWHCSLQ